MWDVFICHASEDKADVAIPLVTALNEIGVKTWIDENELHIGDVLREKIEDGLSLSTYGVVILSHKFFAKEKWPKRELDILFSLETSEMNKILPIWHNVTVQEVLKYSPILAGRFGCNWNIGPKKIAQQILFSLIKNSVKEKEDDFESLNFSDFKYDKIKKSPLINEKNTDNRIMSYFNTLAEIGQYFVDRTGGIKMSLPILFTCVESAIFEMDTIKNSYNLELIGRLKKAAIMAKWIAMFRPIQIIHIDDSTISLQMICANELFAIFIALTYLDAEIKFPYLQDKEISNVLYAFRFRKMDVEEIMLRIQRLIDNYKKSQ